MKCVECEKDAMFKDFTGLVFCSKWCLIKNYKQDTATIIDLLIEENMIQEVNE